MSIWSSLGDGEEILVYDESAWEEGEPMPVGDIDVAVASSYTEYIRLWVTDGITNTVVLITPVMARRLIGRLVTAARISLDDYGC